MQVRNAKSEDLAEVMRCVEAARNYMRANGNPHQWTDGYPSEELLTNDIKNQQLYVCVGDDDKIHGVFAFIIGADPTYAYIENGAWLNDEPYGAIHRIGSDGEAKGIFAAAINYCKGQIKNLRIDTHEKNQTMRYLLAKHGFKEVGTIYIEDGSPRIAFQLVQE